MAKASYLPSLLFFPMTALESPALATQISVGVMRAEQAVQPAASAMSP